MLSSFLDTFSSYFSPSNSLSTQSEPSPSAAGTSSPSLPMPASASSSSHSTNQETIVERNIFAECVNFINDRNYEGLYNSMLLNSANLWVNELNPEAQENLLHYATLANDHIAFDIVMLFGAKIDSNWLALFVQKTNESGALLTPHLYDRIISILSNSYILPEKVDVFDRIPPYRKNRLTKFCISNLTFNCDSDFIKNTPENFFKALDVIAMNSAFIDLVKDATLGHPYIVEFASREEMVSKADCNQTCHIIRIQRDLKYPEILRLLVFELCNAANEEFYIIEPRNYSNRMDYAYACERSEFNSLLRSYKVMESLLIDGRLEAFRSKDGTQTLAQYFNRILLAKYKTFDQCWMRQNQIFPPRTISHADHYRLHYDRYHEFMNIISNKRLYNALDIEPALFEPATQPVIFTNINSSECLSSLHLRKGSTLLCSGRRIFSG